MDFSVARRAFQWFLAAAAETVLSNLHIVGIAYTVDSILGPMISGDSA